MRLKPVVIHLRANCPSLTGGVRGVAEFARITDGDQSKYDYPCAFVVPLDDDVKALKIGHIVEADLYEQFAIVVALKLGDRDENGDRSHDAAHDHRDELLRALFGWVESEDGGPLFYEGSEMLDLDRARLLVQFNFGREVRINSAADGWRVEAEALSGVTFGGDVIDPAADPNRSYPGPDGRIEIGAEIAVDPPADP